VSERSERVQRRAQTGLPALAIALLVVTMVTGIGLAMADGAISGADREPGERRVAVSLAAGLIAPESPLTERANVLDASRLSRFDETRLRTAFPVANETAVAVELDGRSVAATGETDRGTTIRRLVVVEEQTAETLEPALGWQRRVTLPRRGYRANLTLSPPASTNITAVRANSRVALHDDDGLSGQYEIPLSRFETTTVRFSASGPLPPGSVRIEYDAIRTRKATLAVSADG